MNNCTTVRYFLSTKASCGKLTYFQCPLKYIYVPVAAVDPIIIVDLIGKYSKATQYLPPSYGEVV